MKVRLLRSAIGKSARIKKTLNALKLTKINRVVDIKDRPSIMGMIDRVKHMVEIVKD